MSTSQGQLRSSSFETKLERLGLVNILYKKAYAAIKTILRKFSFLDGLVCESRTNEVYPCIVLHHRGELTYCKLIRVCKNRDNEREACHM